MMTCSAFFMEPKASADLVGPFTSFITNDGIGVKVGKWKESSSPPADLLLVNFGADFLCEMIMFLFRLTEVFCKQIRLYSLLTVPPGIISW